MNTNKSETFMYFSWPGKFVPIYEKNGGFQVSHPDGGCYSACNIEHLKENARQFSPGYKTKKEMVAENTAWDREYVWVKAN